MDNIVKKIKKLEKNIQYHDTLYYQDARPEISDFEYDLLKQDLEALKEQISTQIDLFPTNPIPSDHTRGFQQRPHKYPMLSLDNTYNEADLLTFNDKLERLLTQKGFDYTIEPKIDGLAISLTYVNGKLQYGLTRGNGITGDDVTKNLQTIPQIPQHLDPEDDYPNFIEIRGEIYLTYDEFQRINALQITEGEEPYANPRNLAAGTLKLLDSQMVMTRKLQFIAYGIGACEPKIFKTQYDIHQKLKSWGFPTSPHVQLTHTIANVWQHIQSFDKLRHELPFATDGVVIKLNELHLQSQAGHTAKAPRAMIAYKFAPEQVETTLTNITLQVGRTGVITPVAELKPVNLDGSTITRATLHNADEITRKDIRIHDAVIIEKAGDIIPVVIKSLPEKRALTIQPFVFPKNCPVCKTELIRLPDEVAWRCQNPDCPAQIERRLIHFASKQAVNIENLGPAIIQQLIEKQFIRQLTDIYQLNIQNLLTLSGFAQKSSENLLQAITMSKSADLWRFIHGLGIPHIGSQTAKDLAKTFLSLENFSKATYENLNTIPGIGDKVTKSILSFFQLPHNQETLQNFNKLGIQPTSPSTTPLKLANKTFALTGTLPHMTREEAQALIEKVGGKITQSISKNTHYVVAGEAAGSKLTKAQTLNIPILDEIAFKQLIEENL